MHVFEVVHVFAPSHIKAQHREFQVQVCSRLCLPGLREHSAMFTQHNRLTTPFPEPMLIVRDMRLHGKIKIKLVMSGN
jgi:hypothetical protein